MKKSRISTFYGKDTWYGELYSPVPLVTITSPIKLIVGFI